MGGEEKEPLSEANGHRGGFCDLVMGQGKKKDYTNYFV